MGNRGAAAMGVEQANITVDESVNGIVNVVDNATKETHGGKYLEYSGKFLPW